MEGDFRGDFMEDFRGKDTAFFEIHNTDKF